jgi:hypothetical protein
MPRKKKIKEDKIQEDKMQEDEVKKDTIPLTIKEEWEKIVDDRGIGPDDIKWNKDEKDEKDEEEGREIPYHPWVQNFMRVTQEDEPELLNTNVTTYTKEGQARTELDTAIVKKIEIIPSPDPKTTTINFFMQKEEGDEMIPFEALNGLLISSITEHEFYMSVIGDPLPSVLFFANELRSSETFIWNLVMSGFTFAIGDSNYDQLATIHNVLDELQNMVLDRYQILKEKDIREYLGLGDNDPLPENYQEKP